MNCGCHQLQAFIPPIPSLRSFRRGLLLCRPPHRQHHTFGKTPVRSPLRALSRLGPSSVRIVAVQTSPVSGDNDGELHEEQTALQKGYSVGVTIVSGYDASLRRSIIEQIAAGYDAGRLVVVTSGGIASTEEPDALGREGTISNRFESDPGSADDVSNSKVAGDDTNGSRWDEGESDGSLENDSDECNYSRNLATKPEGWISCSSTDEMAEVIAKLATSRECDYIVAEGSMDTNMEPQDFARLFRNRGGASLRVDTLVSVVDGSMLLKDLSGLPVPREEESAGDDGLQTKDMSRLSSTNSPEDMRDLTDTRPMTVVSLVENANVVVLKQASNSTGLVDMSRARELVNVLNGAADIIPATGTQVPIDKLVNTNTYDHESFLFGATWKRVLLSTRNISNGSARPTLPKSLKDATFVYRARRPFHPTRLYEHIKAVATFAGVIRSTGRIWLATRMLAPLEWNQAGVSATLRVGDLFWAAVAEEDWPTDDAQRERIMEDWDTQYGDRETEIVFVGKGIDKLRLQGLLDGCLLQDEEMVFNNMWENFDDPFVEWVPLIEDDEEVPPENEELLPEPALQEEQPDTEGMEKQLTNEDYLVQAEANSFDSQGEVLDIADADEGLSKEESGRALDDLSHTGNEAEEIFLQEPLQDFSTEGGQEPTEIVTPDPDEKKGIVDEQESEPEATAGEGNMGLSAEDAERELEPPSALSNSLDSGKSLNSEGGPVSETDLSDDVMSRISTLDMFEDVLLGSDSNIQPLPSDSEYDEDDTIIASWDGSVADGILKQVPKHGLPVTVVTGFLGSGKTTLLNYILKEDHGLRIAVLVNEFGDIDIDNQLVEKGDWSSKDEVMELANGCICCNINDSFLNAVSKILERSDDVDYLIVETTGVADPVPVINSLMASDIAQQVRVDGILTVVDADNFDPDSMKSKAALSQIMAADSILMSKTDVASPERVQKTIEYLKSVRPAARILRSQNGRVPINMILDVGIRVADSPAHFDPVITKSNEKEGTEVGVDDDDSRTPAMQNVDFREPSSINEHEQGVHHEHEHEDGHGHEHEHEHGHEHEHEHEHDHQCGPDCTHESHEHHHNHLEVDGFVTTSFKSDKPLDPDMFMNNFLSKLPEGVFRAKGLLSFNGYPGRYVFQLSGRRYSFEEDEWPEGVEPGNQLVIIGRDLDLETLKTKLGECIV